MERLKIEKNQSTALLTQRVTIGILILFHGIANTGSGFAFIKSVLVGHGIPEFLAYGAFLGEVMAPLLIIAGFRTRLAGLALAINMLVAILSAHAGDILSLNAFGAWAIELQLFYLLGGVALFFSGAGAYAASKDNFWD